MANKEMFFNIASIFFLIHEISYCAQCGNFRNFLPLKIFYVKPISRTKEDQKAVVLTHLEVLNFDFCEFLHFLKTHFYLINKI